MTVYFDAQNYKKKQNGHQERKKKQIDCEIISLTLQKGGIGEPFHQDCHTVKDQYPTKNKLNKANSTPRQKETPI
jgi:hypothetical protein